MARRKKKKQVSADRIKANGRLNLNIDPALKRWLVRYVARKHTSITALVVNHFVDLREKDASGDVEQI